jgi:hypothetical protein
VVAEHSMGRPFHFLFEGGLTAARSRSPGRIVDSLLSHLGMRAVEGHEDLLRLRARAFVRVDSLTGELVVPEWPLDLDLSAFALLEEVAPEPPRSEPSVDPGRYPVVVWAFHGEGDEPSPARAVTEALSLVLGGVQDSTVALPVLSEVLDRAARLRVDGWGPDTVDRLTPHAG